MPLLPIIPNELADLDDVDLSTPATDGQVLKYDDDTSTWVPAADDTGSALPTATTKGDIAVYDGDSWEILAAGTNTHVLTADSGETLGLKWAAGGGGGGSDARLLVAGNTSDQTISSNSLTDVTGLGVSVESGKTYQFTAVLIYGSASTSNGITLAVNGPTFVTNGLGVEFHIWVASATIVSGYRNVRESGVSSTSVSVANDPFVARITGTIRTSAAGTLQIRAASENNGTNVFIRAGSSLVVVATA